VTIERRTALLNIDLALTRYSHAGGWIARVFLSATLVCVSSLSFAETEIEVVQAVVIPIDDIENTDLLSDSPAPVITASMLQPTPLLEPRINIPGDNSRAATNAPTGVPVSTTNTPAPISPATFGNRDFVTGKEALPQASTDLGSLLKRSPSSLSVGVQSKTPIVSDPRVRGARIGSLAASGSHWVPARIDLDTMLSKFDSRNVESVSITPGPFTSLLGPGFAFTDVQVLRSPRYLGGFQAHGSTDADYRANGNQTFGQQSLLFGSSDWGARFNYGNRQGGDYTAGGGLVIPSSYNSSQEMTLALGRDWKDDSIELNVLRLDQTGILYPGYVFDLDYLVTDGYEATHTREGFGIFDRIETDVWYNRTRFEGNAQNASKRQFFPVLDLISYEGFTDVDSTSTGYRQSMILGGGGSDAYKFSVGHDLRFIRQELNEVSNGVSFGLPLPFNNRNSPIPKSFQANPGLFMEYVETINESIEFKTGGRVDYAQTDVTDTPEKLREVGLDFFPASYSDIMGTDQYQRDFFMLSAFGVLTRDYGDGHTGTASLGYSERPPNLTELYAAQPFMLLLQNGLNNVTGDPTLKNEQLLQVDLGWEYQGAQVRSGVRAYHAWGFDYITFENTLVNYIPPNGDVGQQSLRYVNTALATITGAEAFGELFPSSPFTPFGTVKFVDGRDRTRNGDFATSNGSRNNPSQKVDGLSRGFFSGIAGSASEPLPGIPPLESRIGCRYHDTSPRQRWNFELSTRIVDQQDRIATSLLETRTPSFTTWDMRSVFRPFDKRNLVVATGVENFFDKRYREHFDFRTQNGLSIFQPGANFYVSTTLTY
jgi:iron complex outermembrane receptor protein